MSDSKPKAKTSLFPWVVAFLLTFGLGFAIKTRSDSYFTSHGECEEAIKKYLKAPSTAKFSNWKDDDSIAIKYIDLEVELNPSVLTVDVDAQNSFGAMLRDKWSCQRFKSSSGTSVYSLVEGMWKSY